MRGRRGGDSDAMRRIEALLRGPYPRLPRPLDACSEQWSRLRPRSRTLAAALLVVAALLAVDARVRAAESRWGGAPRPALVATTDLPVGARATGLRPTVLPPAAVPADAVATVAGEAVLALALPAGAVLTRDHLDPRGPAAGLPAGLRAVPVPAEQGWGVTAGGWVDVWVLGAGDTPAELVARSRPVLEVRGDTTGTTALVGLAADEVGPATTGLALGRVLLAHAPAPPD